MPRSSFFLRITDADDNDVPGEALEHDFVGAIEVTSWDWGVDDKAAKEEAQKRANKNAQSPAPKPAAGHGETGKETYDPHPLRVGKHVDRATTRLMVALRKKEKFPSAVFTLRQEWVESTSPREFLLHLILSDVEIADYSLEARAQNLDVTLEENWTFRYRTLQFDYASAGSLEAPGLGEEFVLRADSTTEVAKQPQPTTADLQRQGADKDRQIADLLARVAKLESRH